MESGGDTFKFMMEIDRPAADLHRLGDKSVTELRKCVNIVSVLSADFEMECRMLENNPAGLNMAEIKRVVGSLQQTSQVATGLEGIVGIEGHHHGESREGEEEETPPQIRW